jgi:hypothetical protein
MSNVAPMLRWGLAARSIAQERCLFWMAMPVCLQVVPCALNTPVLVWLDQRLLSRPRGAVVRRISDGADRDAGRAVVGRRICPAHDTAEMGAEVRAPLTELGHQRFIT